MSKADSVALFPLDNAIRAVRLTDLANALYGRFQQTGQMEHLEECIELHSAVLGLLPLDDPDRSYPLSNLAITLHTRFEQIGCMEDLEKSIELRRTVLGLCPSDHPDRSTALNGLAVLLLARFEQMGQQEDREEAVELSRAALFLCPVGHAERSQTLNNLACAIFLRKRFDQTSHMVEDLEESIILHRAALDLRPVGHVERSHSLNNLATALHTRFEQIGRINDLEECIKLQRKALDLHPLGHPARSTSLSNLAGVVLTRFRQKGRFEDLEECVELQRAGLALYPLDHPARSVSLNNLAATVHHLFDQKGRVEDLEECVELLREALALHPVGHAARPGSLSNLADAVCIRWQCMGRVEDLQEGVELHRAALDLHPVGHRDRAIPLTNLANAILNRFHQTNHMKDLEESIELLRAGLALRPLGHTDRSASLNNLAAAVLTRFAQTGLIEDLERGIDLLRSGLVLRPVGHPDRSASLYNLALAVFNLFQETDWIGALEEAIDLHRAALDLRPLGHPRRSSSLEDLATAVHFHGLHTSCVVELTESFDLYRSAVEHQFSPVVIRLQAALAWAAFARILGHSTTLDGYEAALSLLARLLALSPTLEMQHEQLIGTQQYSTLGLEAASYAIETGDVIQAIEMLEQGRALLWSALYGLRTPIEELKLADKGLADEFLKISRALESISTSSNSRPLALKLGNQMIANTTNEDRIGQMLSRKRQLEEARVALIGKIRALPGGTLKDFLRAAPFELLRMAAVEGPVIVVCVAESCCDALIVLVDHDSTIRLPLGSIYEALLSLSTRLLDARKDLKTRPKEYDNELRESLKALWKLVVGPVTRRLLELGVKPGSRIWWCPTSVLGTLPLHAAGVVSPPIPEAPKAKYVSDIFICSYTPTLMALIKARSSSPLSDERRSMLVVWNDRSLRTVRDEVNVLREFEPSITELHCSNRETSERVEDGLREHSWVHIACHGRLVPKKPFKSTFLLSGGKRLSLLKIVRSHLPNAEFAFLSACHSAGHTSEGGYDEVLHLAAAMLFCGFRSVVGTMWEMADIDGPHLAKEFYKVMLAEDGLERGSRRAARAIRDAAKSLRKKKDLDGMPVTLERWVNYVHFGV